MTTAVIILAAGSGTRAELGFNKLLYSLGNETVLERTLARFVSLDRVVVASQHDYDEIRALLPAEIPVLRGGATRCASSRIGVSYCAEHGYDNVLIHDGARTELSARDLAACLNALESHGNCIMTLPCRDSVRVDGRSVPRDRVSLMATPQAFRTADIARAFERAPHDEYTDDASVYELYCTTPLHYEICLDANPKLTTRDDLLALEQRTPRAGIGYDEHRIAQNRNMILCGVKFDVPYGLVGHSDADAPVHAVMDAMLSAAGLRDIGTYYPDTDDRFAGADSLVLLDDALANVRELGFEPANVSLVIHAQRPKIAPRIGEMCSNLARRMGLARSEVGITATTGEGMGHIGKGEGLAAQAIVMLRRRSR